MRNIRRHLAMFVGATALAGGSVLAGGTAFANHDHGHPSFAQRCADQQENWKNGSPTHEPTWRECFGGPVPPKPIKLFNPFHKPDPSLEQRCQDQLLRLRNGDSVDHATFKGCFKQDPPPGVPLA
jgi:hypothetical protein